MQNISFRAYININLPARTHILIYIYTNEKREIEPKKLKFSFIFLIRRQFSLVHAYAK